MTTVEIPLEVRGMTVRRSGRTVLREVSLSLEPGITALVGPNGAGKSTLLRALATVDPVSRGVLLSRGEPVKGRTLRAYRRALGYLPQDASWHDWMSVEETVRLFAWLHGLPRAQIGCATDAALGVADLQDRRGERSAHLSGGEYQRLMLATTVVHRPAVLLLDEPTVGLDPGQRIQFRRMLQRVGENTVVLMSTHLLDDTARSAGQIHVLSAGSIVFSGSPADLSGRGDATVDGVSRMESGYLSVLGGRS